MTKRQAARVRLIRSLRCYSSKELAAVLQVTPHTVLRWQKLGLEPIESSAHHFLFLGRTAKAFLLNLLAARKHPLKPEEFYCPRCRIPRLPKLQSRETTQTGTKMGKGKELVLHRGICDVCGSRMVRIAAERAQTGDSDTGSDRSGEKIITTLATPCE